MYTISFLCISEEIQKTIESDSPMYVVAFLRMIDEAADFEIVRVAFKGLVFAPEN